MDAPLTQFFFVPDHLRDRTHITESAPHQLCIHDNTVCPIKLKCTIGWLEGQGDEQIVGSGRDCEAWSIRHGKTNKAGTWWGWMVLYVNTTLCAQRIE
jgi:hypothetical protein